MTFCGQGEILQTADSREFYCLVTVALAWQLPVSSVLPCSRIIMMCSQVAKLQRASLRDPVKVEVCNKYQTVDKLLQFYLFIPAREKVTV